LFYISQFKVVNDTLRPTLFVERGMKYNVMLTFQWKFKNALWKLKRQTQQQGNRRQSHFAAGAAPWWITLSVCPISYVPYSPLWANTEAHTALHYRHRMTEPRPQLTRTENFMKFRRVVFVRGQTGTQTQSSQYFTIAMQ